MKYRSIIILVVAFSLVACGGPEVQKLPKTVFILCYLLKLWLKNQKFINGGTPGSTSEVIEEPTNGITAISISPNKRFAAVAEKGTTGPWITIYDLFTLRKKKILTTNDCTCIFIANRIILVALLYNVTKTK